jgi:hypothetical protein
MWMVANSVGAAPATAVPASPESPPSARQSAGSDPVDLRFSGFFKLPIGPQGLEIADALQAADGRRVRLVGYMVAQEQPAAGRFMLTARPVRMSEHADGDADDLPPATVTVLLDESQRDRVVVHQPGPLALSGRLTVRRVEDASGRVSWVQLHLDPDEIATTRLGMSSSQQLFVPTPAR